ncbi:hypothetical protein FRC12_018893 [Ceratobasidium sp. 428]|nr:hypothetical protein FRC12_018893 [Ceratobasidium sp. 428]
MARGGTMYARAERRAAMRAPRLSEANGTQPSDVSRRTCRYCGKEFKSQEARDCHITVQRFCHAKHEDWISGRAGQKRRREYEVDSPIEHVMDSPPPAKQVRLDETAQPVAGPSRHPDAIADPTPTPDPASGTAPDPYPDPDPTAPVDGGKPRGYTKDGVYIEPFPVRTAGAPISTKRKNDNTDLRDYLASCGALGDPELFETAEVMMTTGLSGKARTRHLKSPAYRAWKGKGKAVWPNNDALLRDINRLPTGPDWRTEDIVVGQGQDFESTHILHLRDIIEAARELVGARRFRRCMKWAPEHRFTSRNKKCQIYDEMSSGDWWWGMQCRIRNKNGTVVPLIVASDGTSLTNNANGPEAHPIYLSIGNISKTVRRMPTKRSMILLGYLPNDEFEEIEDLEVRQKCRWELLHRSLAKIFEPLKSASKDGVLARCADGYVRHIYPVLAAWIADFPEQTDLACTTRSGCPKCTQGWTGRGQGGPMAPLRNQEEMAKIHRGYQLSKDARVLTRLTLKPVAPFWDGIPFFDMGRALAPDLLHQLYKGMYEHLRNWIEDLLGTVEFNRRFKTMPLAQDLRHFNKGVTKVKIWAGRESRDMMRQFLPVVVDAQVPAGIIRLVRSFMVFSYLAHSAQLTDVELAEMDKALKIFHKAKYILTKGQAKILKTDGAFDRLAKLHMIGHYQQDIRELGTPDGYSTETPEHLHILYVKIPWRMSNRRNPLPQMVQYVRYLEALEIQQTFIEEFYGRELSFRVEDIVFDDDEEEADGNKSEEDEEDDADSGDELDDGVEIPSGEPDRSAVLEIHHYPQPAIAIARRPTLPRVPADEIISSYGASDFIRALRRFLLTKTTRPEDLPTLLPSDTFPLWHKAVFNHIPLPFAPCEPRHRDVIRARPPTRDTAGRLWQAGVFDTALFAADATRFGLERYRAGRVRAIFSLPPALAHLHDGPLVYMDVFEPFSPNPASTHCMFSTTLRHSGEAGASLVLPLTCLKMACHLAPDFASPLTRIPGPTGALANVRLLFNDFYNNYTFLLLNNWQRVS